MTGKEKLYLLLIALDDARTITPSGRPLLISPFTDLNNNYQEFELVNLFTKLDKDEHVLTILSVPSRTRDVDAIEELDSYEHTDDGYWHIQLLPAFEAYFQNIEREPEYQAFTGKKITPESEIERLFGKVHEMDDQIERRRNALARAHSENNNNPIYSEASRVGGIAKLEEQAQMDIGNYIKQKESYLAEIRLRKTDTQSEEVPQAESQILPTSVKVPLHEKEAKWSDDFRWAGKAFVFGQYGSITFHSPDRRFIFKALTVKKGGWTSIKELKGDKDAGYVRSTIKHIEDRLPPKAKGHITIVSTQDDDSIGKPNDGAYRIKILP